MAESEVESWRLSVCPYCGVGCGVDVGVAQGPVVAVRGMREHSGTRTRHIPPVCRALPEPFVELHPDDAEGLGVADGSPVHVETRRGRVRARARVSHRARKGAIFVPYPFGALAGADREVGSLTHRAYDEVAMQPEYKACAARVVPLDVTAGE